MSEFSTEVDLELTVDDRSLAQARDEIGEAVQDLVARLDIGTGARADGGRSRGLRTMGDIEDDTGELEDRDLIEGRDHPRNGRATLDAPAGDDREGALSHPKRTVR